MYGIGRMMRPLPLRVTGTRQGRTELAFDWKLLLTSLATGAALGRVPLVVTGLVMALLAFSAARVTWLVFPPPAESTAITTSEPQTPSATTRNNPQKKNHENTTHQLLGAPRADNAPVAGQPIPETQLNLLLRGVAASGGAGAAGAGGAGPAG